MKTPPMYSEDFAGDVLSLWSLNAAPSDKPSSFFDERFTERKCQELCPRFPIHHHLGHA